MSSEKTELKKAIESKITEYESYKINPTYSSEIEQNAVHIVLKELRYLNSIHEFEEVV